MVELIYTQINFSTGQILLMLNRTKTILIFLLTAIILGSGIFSLIQLFIGGNTLGLWLGIFLLSVIVLLGGIIYWVLNEILATDLSDLKKLSFPQRTRGVSTPKVKQEVVEPSQPRVKPDITWLKQTPNITNIMSSKMIIEAFKQGQKDFQDVSPSAAGDYGTYFKWASLDGIDFSRSTLYRAPFDGTSLIGSNFSGAYLSEASFKGAVLRQAKLNYADLSKADFTGADLTGSDLSFASLKSANLTNTILIGATLTKEQLDSAASLSGATLPDGTAYSA